LTLQNFAYALDLMDIPKSFLLSVSIAGLSSLLQIVSCAFAGYGFSRFTFKGRGLLFAGVLFTIIVPPQTYIIPLYLQYRFFDFFGIGRLIGLIVGRPLTVNLLNKTITFYLPAALGSGIRSGLFIYIFTQFFRGMPRELEDAAHIDGCGFFMTFVRIFVPNSVPAFLTVFLFSFVWYWNDYFFSSMFFSSLFTISTGLASIRSQWLTLGLTNPDANMFLFGVTQQAAALVAVGPVLIMYVLLQRHFTESIERTGIVG
jgi:multiple sugar transport system permease protein